MLEGEYRKVPRKGGLFRLLLPAWGVAGWVVPWGVGHPIFFAMGPWEVGFQQKMVQQLQASSDLLSEVFNSQRKDQRQEDQEPWLCRRKDCEFGRKRIANF